MYFRCLMFSLSGPCELLFLLYFIVGGLRTYNIIQWRKREKEAMEEVSEEDYVILWRKRARD